MFCFFLFWDIEKGDVNKWILAMDLFNVLVWFGCCILIIVDARFNGIENDIDRLNSKINKLQNKLNDIE